jgi:hypothetical protein
MTCINPITIYKYAPTDAGMDVPCGKCTPCRIRRASEWAIRCEHELEDWDNACFIRLSYHNDYLPGDKGVHKDELQRFFKRLRKRLQTDLAYIACGEYGESTERAHYHAILFGYDRRWQFGGDDQLRSHPNFRWNGTCWDVLHGPLTDSWKKGQITLGTANPKSARYIAAYTLKSNVGKIGDKHHDGRPAPFLLTSRGIGRRYCTRNRDKLLSTLSIRRNGKEIGLPRQYHIWLGTTTEALKEKAKETHKDIYDHWKKQGKTDDQIYSYIMQDRRNKAKTTQARRDLNEALHN